MTDAERMKEWLTRVADDVSELRKKPRMGKAKKLAAIRQSYDVLSVMIKVAQGTVYMKGISPPKGVK